MMVINGVTNWTYDVDPARLEMAYTHFLISEEEYLKLKDCFINYKLKMYQCMPVMLFWN